MVGQQHAACWNGLEPARAPAAIHVESRRWRLANQRARIVHDIDDPRPVAKQTDASEARIEIRDSADDLASDRVIAALGVGGIEIEPAAKDEPAFVRLADIATGRERPGNDV